MNAVIDDSQAAGRPTAPPKPPDRVLVRPYWGTGGRASDPSQLAKNIAAGLTEALPPLAPAAGVLVEATALLAGGFLISYGAWSAWHPAGFLVGGALLLAGVILRARGS